jgi:glucose/arabinose dehydrogenase
LHRAAPPAAAGLQVMAFTRGLAHPRWLLVLPNDEVLVAENNAPHSGCKVTFVPFPSGRPLGAAQPRGGTTVLAEPQQGGLRQHRP